MALIHSAGAVLYTVIDGERRYVLVREKNGSYGLPKGHVEPGESLDQTALREVREETGLRIRLVEGFRTTDEHPIPEKKDTIKQIVYFLGTYEDQEPVYQREELSGLCLVSYEEAMGMFQFESSRRILRETNAFLLERA